MQAVRPTRPVWRRVGEPCRRGNPDKELRSPKTPLARSFHHQEIVLDTTAPQEVVDITDQVRAIVRSALDRHGDAAGGLGTVSSKHTTCAVIVNENEHFLKGDILAYLNQAVPRDSERYKHNDLQCRPATDRDREAIVRNNFGGYSSVEAFMAQEPVNAHAHLQAILCGNSATFGVRDGDLALGSWCVCVTPALCSHSARTRILTPALLSSSRRQSVMFVELDGPRSSRIASVTCLVGD